MLVDLLFKNIAFQFFAPKSLLKNKYQSFKKILRADREAHIHLALLEETYYNEKEVDCYFIEDLYEELSKSVLKMVNGLIEISPIKYSVLREYYKKIDFYCRFLLSAKYLDTGPPYVFGPKEKAKEKENILLNLLGGKGYHLFLVAKRLSLPVPHFFIVTTNGFFAFLEENNLIPTIKESLSKIDIKNPRKVDETCSYLEKNLINAKIPRALRDDVEGAISRYFGGDSDIKFSIRSSAVSEDTENTFAGQYLTLLGVQKNDVLNAYKRILMSKYHPNAVFYRIKRGFCDLETPMAVIIQEMIEPEVAGVAYSSSPFKVEKDDAIYIYPAMGRGEQVVSGSVSPNEIRIDKKEKRISGPGKGILSKKHTYKLFEWAIKLEGLIDEKVDLEWCIDKKGSLFLLQVRPLIIKEEREINQHLDTEGLKLLLKGGQTASRGISSGKVHLVRDREELLSTPEGAILVARSIPPEYVVVFERLNGILSEKGSSASHSASVARELEIPFICNLEGVTTSLKEGQEITIDANKCEVFLGRKKLSKKEFKKGKRPLTPRQNLLKQLLKLSCQLSLKDPTHKDFRPEGCRSLHDIIRFVHETAMREMFSLGQKGGGKRGTKILESELPLVFYVMDVGGGLVPESAENERIKEEQISSFPMLYFLKGLKHPSIDWSRTEHFAWGEFDSVILAGGVMTKDSFSLASYAILAQDYMNLNIRFGYHFVQIDAHYTEEKESNYIFFRFSGGGGDPSGRIKRARFLVEVLKGLGFDASHTGDLVDARINDISKSEMAKILEEVGRLVGATRLMDMYLTHEEDPRRLAKEFLQGKSDFSKT